MDLSQFDTLSAAQEQGIDVEILDPAGKPIGVSIKMAGPDSERAKKAQRRITNARLARRNLKPLTAEEIEEEVMASLGDMTISWSPITLDGADLPCTPDNAAKLYRRFPFIRDQVNEAAGDRAGFLQPSASPSAKP